MKVLLIEVKKWLINQTEPKIKNTLVNSSKNTKKKITSEILNLKKKKFLGGGFGPSDLTPYDRHDILGPVGVGRRGYGASTTSASWRP